MADRVKQEKKKDKIVTFKIRPEFSMSICLTRRDEESFGSYARDHNMDTSKMLIKISFDKAGIKNYSELNKFKWFRDISEEFKKHFFADLLKIKEKNPSLFYENQIKEICYKKDGK